MGVVCREEIEGTDRVARTDRYEHQRRNLRNVPGNADGEVPTQTGFVGLQRMEIETEIKFEKSGSIGTKINISASSSNHWKVIRRNKQTIKKPILITHIIE